MKPITFLLLFMVTMATAALGAPKKPAHKETPMEKISEMSATSITLSLGHSGDTHVTYKITGSTVVILEGVPAHVSDLRAGMVARVKPGSNETAAEIEAKSAPAHPRKGRVG